MLDIGTRKNDWSDSQVCTMPNYWTNSTPNCKKKTASFRATANLVQLEYDLLYHSPYSPDLTSSDFFLLWQKIESNEEVIVATKAHFTGTEQTYFSDRLNKLEHC
ncbi:uncharacterized protein LOC143195569 [Rhynchophorus ferrugineus]|uniref:uncharacterized protein LOC143195569 n=1 Tax=Rhynchophorus ferrugineus TaxID=354439 RepID=UPI003FCE3818